MPVYRAAGSWGRTMGIKKKDLFILEIIEKLTVVTSTNLTILAGYHDVSVVRKRLKALVAEGYLSEHRFNAEKLYFLTGRGLAELEIAMKPYAMKGFSTDHYAEVSAAAAWLYTKTKTSIYDMAFDRDITKAQKEKQYRLVHAPDIIFSHKCIEVELNAKKMERMQHNFRENARCFDQQIWILPERLARLSKKLQDLSAESNTKLYLISLERMHAQISAYDLKTNVMRDMPVRTVSPSPMPFTEVREIIEQAGGHTWIWEQMGNDIYVIDFAFGYQGILRTQMAEKIVSEFKERGYDAFVYYQID